MYADDTTVYCLGENVYQATAQLNKALHELYIWCLDNRFTPHPKKCETILYPDLVLLVPLRMS